MECSIEACATWRCSKGARGFEDGQGMANDTLMGRVEKIYSKSESRFELVYQGVLDMGLSAGATEIQVRENEKLAAIGEFSGTDPYSGLAVNFNERSIKAAQRARAVLAEVRQRSDAESTAIRDAFADGTVSSLYRSARSDIAHRLAEYTMKTVEYQEVLEVWDEIDGLTSNVDDLYEYLDNGLGQFIEARQQPARGTQPHSPLPWWKWFLIALVLCSTAAAIAACVIYFACGATGALIAAAAFAIFLIVAWAC